MINRNFLNLVAIEILFLWVSKLGAAIPYEAGEWEALYDEGFRNWSIESFSYEGSVADGGSHIFKFTTTENGEFSLLVANVGYWTERERDASIQVFFLVTHEDKSEVPKLFKVQADSEEERILLRMLKQVIENPKKVSPEDLKMLKLTVDHLESRKVFPKFLP
jgi:hypothetical protein